MTSSGEAAELRRSVSETRFATFLGKAKGDESLALALHDWNTEVSAAFMVPLAHVIIGVRNRFYDSIATRNGKNWLTTATWLQRFERNTVSNITGYISGRSATTGVIGPIVPGAIVAELPLHFWVALTSTRYDKSIWRSSLASVFPREARPPIHDALDRIRTLRNRIAHHEHLLNRDLRQDAERIDRILTMVSPSLAHRTRTMSTVIDVLDRKPG
jgi:hypothetical protein